MNFSKSLDPGDNLITFDLSETSRFITVRRAATDADFKLAVLDGELAGI